jgi:lipid II:glycine glycyltransferase (peptidoglycan interpeptide bridge formation enzyme)
MTMLKLQASDFAIIEPDISTWNQFTQQHPQGHLLQSGPWGQLKSNFGWNTQRIAITNKQGIIAGVQLLFRQRYGISVAYAPRGPLFSGVKTYDNALIQAMHRIAKRRRAVFLRLEPNLLETQAQGQQFHSQLLLKGFRTANPIQPQSSIHLDLTPDLDKMLAAMSKGHRADIRRAERNGVSVWNGSTTEDFDTFYSIFEQTAQRADFAIHSKEYYQVAQKAFQEAQHSQLLLAGTDGQATAAFLIFGWANDGLYLYSCSTDIGLKSGANHLLQWHALQWSKQQGYTNYDFWGIPDAFGQAALAPAEEREHLEEQAKQDPLYGVFRFKKGFGGEVVRYLPAYDYVYIAPLYSIIQKRLGLA